MNAGQLFYLLIAVVQKNRKGIQNSITYHKIQADILVQGIAE
jgi:hypothetical protein